VAGAGGWFSGRIRRRGEPRSFGLGRREYKSYAFAKLSGEGLTGEILNPYRKSTEALLGDPEILGGVGTGGAKK